MSQVLRYLLWYWAPGPAWLGLLVMAALAGAALLVATMIPFPAAAAGLRRFLLAALGMVAVTTAAMAYYAARGIDALSAHYIGFFYWSVPLLTLLVAVTGLTAALRGRAAGQALLAGVLTCALGAAILAPGLRADVHDNEPALAPALASAAGHPGGHRAGGRTRNLRTLDADGLVVQAERSGVPLCVAGQYFWVFAVTSQFICGLLREAAGVSCQLHRLPYAPEPGVPVIARLRYSVLTAQEGTSSRG